MLDLPHPQPVELDDTEDDVMSPSHDPVTLCFRRLNNGQEQPLQTRLKTGSQEKENRSMMSSDTTSVQLFFMER
ncbi:unnamed protein product [Coregonus sp. 'balchen']|nr:unnamed protein product [Coregonus sp. 'balchen']